MRADADDCVRRAVVEALANDLSAYGETIKAMYGAREASKCWGNEVTETALRAGCRQVMVDPRCSSRMSSGM